AFTLDPRFFAPYGARDVLGVLHLALADADLLVDDCLLLELHLLFAHGYLDRFATIVDGPIGWTPVDRVALDRDLLARDRHLQCALFGYDLFAELHLAGLDALLASHQLLL